MRKLLLVMVLTGIGTLEAETAPWEPAKGPLMTRWARDVAPDKVHPEYPRPQMLREQWSNLNGLWDYAITERDAERPSSFQGQVMVPFPIESALSGVMLRVNDNQKLWYRRHFTLPETWKGQRILLHFGAVDWEAIVWVNGKKLGTHRGGYDPFSFDITEALKNDAREQELVVAVWDPTDKGPQPRGKQVTRPSGIYYTPVTGIWQTVWLEPVPERHIEGVKIVPDLDAGKVRVTVEARGTPPDAFIEATVSGDEVNIDKPGVGKAVKKVASARGTVGQPIELVIPHNQLKTWSPESPYLYDLRLDLYLGRDAGVDTVHSYFGMRKISLGKDEKGITRLFLNNKPYFQVGPLDQGFWPDGLYTAPTDEALRYDLEMTRKLGFNMCRKHVKVEPARWYYWCDRLGLLVWQDMPSGDRSVPDGGGELTRSKESAEQFETELKRMIDSLHNFPCIVMWVVFNEGWGQFDTVRLTRWTKEYDPTRLANCASGWNDMPVGDVHDIHVYPGPGSPKPEEQRAAVLGEFGGLGLGVDGHSWSKQTWGYRGTASQEDLTRKYERLMGRVWQLKDDPGLSAAVYTQTTDVETEANGLLTYDRAVLKVDLERVAAVNRGDVSRVPQLRTVVATAREKEHNWKYTLARPSEDWFKPDFAAEGWQEGPGGFGTRMTPGSVVRTEWNASDIWLRREFTLPEDGVKDLQLLVHHDEDAEIYLNGVLAARLAGYKTDYEEVAINADALATLKPGKNVMAVHCRQTGGGQYIDVGLGQLVKPK